MTAVCEIKPEHSPLFSHRFEDGVVVSLSNKAYIEQILRDRKYTKQSEQYVATTEISNNLDGSPWQWQQRSFCMEQGSLVVARFRQRFHSDPVHDNLFYLTGGGDLELKIHDRDPSRQAKYSIHIPSGIGIEKLIELSRTDHVAFRNVLTDLAHETGENSINPAVLVVRTHGGLVPLITRCTQREVYKKTNDVVDESKITIDNGFMYHAYPYWVIQEPVFSAVLVEDQSDVVHVEIKSRKRTDETAELLKSLESVKIGKVVRHKNSHAQLRHMALKKTDKIIKESDEYEIEAKLNIEIAESGVNLDDTSRQLYMYLASCYVNNFRVWPQFPIRTSRTAESALYTTYGWVDASNKVHDVFTIIRVESDPPTYWVKRKGDPSDDKTQETLVRTERKEKCTEIPDLDAIIRTESQKVGQDVKRIGAFRKKKISFQVEEIDTGRLFGVSLDEIRMEGAPATDDCLRQLEIEYTKTPREKVGLTGRTIPESSNQLQKSLSTVQLENITLTPTNERKIDWLYRQSFMLQFPHELTDRDCGAC